MDTIERKENISSTNMNNIADNNNNKMNNLPFAACKVDEDGIIESANPMMTQVFAYEGITGANFFALTGVKLSELLNLNNEENSEKKEKVIQRNERYFSLNFPQIGRAHV